MSEVIYKLKGYRHNYVDSDNPRYLRVYFSYDAPGYSERNGYLLIGEREATAEETKLLEEKERLDNAKRLEYKRAELARLKKELGES